MNSLKSNDTRIYFYRKLFSLEEFNFSKVRKNLAFYCLKLAKKPRDYDNIKITKLEIQFYSLSMRVFSKIMTVIIFMSPINSIFLINFTSRFNFFAVC